MPKGFTFEEAAALSFGGNTALSQLHHGAKVARGDKVLIIGASGAVGSAAVQIAKHFGAEVTGVTSTRNVECVRAIGADLVIDYTRGDYLARGDTYDVIYDTVGATDFRACERAMGQKARLVLASGSLPQILGSAWASMTTQHKLIAGPAKERAEHLGFLRELAEAGQLKPLIDRTFSLERIVEAHAYVDTGRKRGSVIITVDHG
jgi:NADPH:quinone reductase-like Zn-dependent oxidoreductase